MEAVLPSAIPMLVKNCQSRDGWSKIFYLAGKGHFFDCSVPRINRTHIMMILLVIICMVALCWK
jgi:hypothetical protein